MLVAMDTDQYTLGRRRKDQVRNSLLINYVLVNRLRTCLPFHTVSC